MSTTRLLVLGVVRIFQPVHGYFVRRELLSWRADQWAAINPGSIYGALKGLTKDAFLEELPGGKGDKVRYQLTSDGETEFFVLLRETLWQVDHFRPGRLVAGLAFLWMLPREEAVEILEGRAAQLDAMRRQAARRGSDREAPGMSAEIPKFTGGLIASELTWLRDLTERVKAGEYAFAGEEALAEHHRRLAEQHATEARAAQSG